MESHGILHVFVLLLRSSLCVTVGRFDGIAQGEPANVHTSMGKATHLCSLLWYFHAHDVRCDDVDRLAQTQTTPQGDVFQ